MSNFYQAMHEVLQRPGYDILTGRAIDYQQIIMEAVGLAIINFFDQLFNMPDPSVYNLRAITTVFVILSALMLFTAVMGLIYFILKLNRFKSGEGKMNPSIIEIFDDIEHNRFNLAELLRLSRSYAAERNFRDAVRHHYIAVLVALDAKKTIRVDKSKTNAQLIRELSKAAPALSGPFASVVEVFHQTWFGKKSVDEDRYRHFASKAEEILYEK
jgi:hypothetical protein